MEKTLEERVQELEKKVAVLEGQVQAQPDEVAKRIIENLKTLNGHIL